MVLSLSLWFLFTTEGDKNITFTDILFIIFNLPLLLKVSQMFPPLFFGGGDKKRLTIELLCIPILNVYGLHKDVLG